jgi:hypothetical protein
VIIGLRERSDEIWQRAFELLRRESPEYRNSIDDEFTKESKAHCNELLRMIVAIASAKVRRSGVEPFDFVRTHAAWRARHQVPLIASLHAYRLAHRTYAEITRDAVLRHGNTEAVVHSLTVLSDFWIQFFDFVGAVLAEAHAVEDGLIVAQGTRRYVDLIDDLLRGSEPSDPEAQRLCVLCGVRPGSPIAVAVAALHQPQNGHHIDLEVTLRSLVRLIDQVLPAAIFGKARMAIEFATAARPLMHFSDIDLQEFVVRRSDGVATRLIPQWMRQVAGGGRPVEGTDAHHPHIRGLQPQREADRPAPRCAYEYGLLQALSDRQTVRREPADILRPIDAADSPPSARGSRRTEQRR